jgi:large subunit ribosomal protein L29
MAIIKKSDLNKMSKTELDKKMNELKRELLKVETQKSMGMVPDNPGRVRELRKTIARIMTIKKRRGGT